MIINFDKIPGLLGQIIKSAFGLEQVGGGVIGMGTSILLGVKRGMFTNEAGLGSTPNAAASPTPANTLPSPEQPTAAAAAYASKPCPIATCACICSAKTAKRCGKSVHRKSGGKGYLKT